MKYTLKNIIDSLPANKNSNSSWWVKLWVRKVSFIFTYLFINMGFSPNAVSVFSIFITLASCVLFSIPSTGCLIVAVILINLWLILDCVDGNIARCKKMKTIYGEFVDAISGYFTVSFIYLAIGVCAFNNGGVILSDNNQWILISGAISSISDILARLINKNYKLFSNSIEQTKSYNNKQENKHSIEYIRKRIGKELGISGMFMPLTILCGFFNAYDLMTIFYLLFNGFALFFTAFIYIYKANKYDKTH